MNVINKNDSPYKIIVCASGGGGNFEAIVKGQIECDYIVTKLIVDRVCGAIEKAKYYNIPYENIETICDKYAKMKALELAIPQDSNLIILAGFLPIISEKICSRWKGKLINTHPSLLPKYGGKGMHGVKVQEAVMAANEEFAGCTVHYVDSEVDSGQIIAQRRIKVNYEETPWELGGRVFAEENILLLEAICLLRNKSSNLICNE
jgi:phosphoribosylglycinamide formyltransferase-1